MAEGVGVVVFITITLFEDSFSSAAHTPPASNPKSTAAAQPM